MPKSQFVASKRLIPLLVYFAVAFVVILVADVVLQSVAPTRVGRQLLVAAWIVLFPLGAWLVWRRA